MKGRHSTIDRDAIIRLRQQGESCPAITAALGYSVNTVSRVCRAAGMGQGYWQQAGRAHRGRIAHESAPVSAAERRTMEEGRLQDIEAWLARIRDGSYHLRDIGECTRHMTWLVGYARSRTAATDSLSKEQAMRLRREMHAVREERDNALEMVRRMTRRQYREGA